jgi:hypothetical protein
MFIKGLTLLVVACIGAEAMVCFHGICDRLPTREPLTGCKGSVIKNGGFCHCYDVCAKVKFKSFDVKNVSIKKDYLFKKFCK